MKKFKDFSITRKLLTGFLSMVLIMVLIAAVGIFGMANISAMDTKLYESQTEPLGHLINALESLYQIRVDTRDAIINVADAKKVKSSEDDFLKNKNIFLTESADYRKSISTQEALDIFDEAASLFTSKCDPVIQEMFVLAEAGNAAEAMATLATGTDAILKLFDN